jgi:hypothetical protein
MVVLWVVAVLALVVAVAALVHARHTAQKLAHLTEMYWQLKFDHGELKAKVDPPAPAAPEVKQTFVPLIGLRSAPAPESSGVTGPPGGTGSTRDQ